MSLICWLIIWDKFSEIKINWTVFLLLFILFYHIFLNLHNFNILLFSSSLTLGARGPLSSSCRQDEAEMRRCEPCGLVQKNFKWSFHGGLGFLEKIKDREVLFSAYYLFDCHALGQILHVRLGSPQGLWLGSQGLQHSSVHLSSLYVLLLLRTISWAFKCPFFFFLYVVALRTIW